jgi:dihydroflavonol-4-reductase
VSSSPTAQTESKPLVLVTGGSGFLAGHTILRLLRDGYGVSTTVRAAGREAALVAMLEAAGVPASGRVDFVVADLSSDDGWAEATRGVDYVLHVASPFPSVIARSEDDVIAPARDGALRVIRAARDAGVKRVVMTSSFAAIGYSPKPGGNYTEDDWTDPADDNTAYIRSKVIAERAAWDFIAAEGGALELSVINPTGIFGPLLDDHVSSSIGLVKAMLDGAMPAVPRVVFGVADVRDVADLHILAMTDPAAAGGRFIATGDALSSLFGIAQTLRTHLGEAGSDLPKAELSDDQVREMAKTNPALKEAVTQLGRKLSISNQKAKTVLGWKPRSTATTITDTAESLITRGLLASE